MPELKVCIKGDLYGYGGYAKTNRNLVRGLLLQGISVQTIHIGSKNNRTDCKDIDRTNKGIVPIKNSISIDSMIPTLNNVSCGKYKILYTTVESCSLPKQFLDVAKLYNEIWVTSDFCKTILEKYNLNIPIFVIPNAIDVDLYLKNCKSHIFQPSLKKFVFMSLFCWSYRKGYDVLLKAYLQEFSSKENVSLLIVSKPISKYSKNNEIQKTIQDFIVRYGNKAPHVARCSRIIEEKDMPSIYRACNVFVLFSRGEGFGLPLVESSLCNLPVISTNHSGHTMFLKENNSTLIQIDDIVKMQKSFMDINYWDEQEFPALTSSKVINDASKAMRYVYENYKEAKSENNILKKYIVNNYSIKKISTIIKKRLIEIGRID